MTRDITITNPSPKMLQVFNIMRERKQQQKQLLAQKKQCTFKIVL